jgi:ATP-dependent RNA helicase DDX27
MATQDFIMTIDSDDEEKVPKKISKDKEVVDDAQLNPDFVFDLSGDPYGDLLGDTSGPQDYVTKGSKPVSFVFVNYSLCSYKRRAEGTDLGRRYN